MNMIFPLMGFAFMGLMFFWFWEQQRRERARRKSFDVVVNCKKTGKKIIVTINRWGDPEENDSKIRNAINASVFEEGRDKGGVAPA